MKLTSLYFIRLLTGCNDTSFYNQSFVKAFVLIFLGIFITHSCSNDDDNASSISTNRIINTTWMAQESLNVSGTDTTVEASLSFLKNNKGVIDVSIPNYLGNNIKGRYEFDYTYSEADKQGEVSHLVLSFVKVNGQAADSSVTSSISTILENYSSPFSIEGNKIHFVDDDDQTVFIRK